MSYIPAPPYHERHLCCSHRVRSYDQVPLILPVLRIEDYDKLSISYINQKTYMLAFFLCFFLHIYFLSLNEPFQSLAPRN